MVTLLLKFRVAPENQRTLLDFLRRAIPYYEQPGGIKVRLLEALETSGAFIELVEYRDADAYERDQVRVESDLKMKALLAEWRALHEGELSVEAYRERRLEENPPSS